VVDDFVEFNPLDQDECNYNYNDCYLNSSYDGWGEEYYWEPCLVFYEMKDVCARCKVGLIRVVSKAGIFCGSMEEDEQTCKILDYIEENYNFPPPAYNY
jgi:hypothetical protein